MDFNVARTATVIGLDADYSNLCELFGDFSCSKLSLYYSASDWVDFRKEKQGKNILNVSLDMLIQKLNLS